jgi:hypothetical protein
MGAGMCRDSPRKSPKAPRHDIKRIAAETLKDQDSPIGDFMSSG